MLKNKIFQYIGVLVGLFLVYRHFPELICAILPESDWTSIPVRPIGGLRTYMRFGVLSVYLIAVIGFSIIASLRDVLQANQRLENEKTIAELALLKSQVNPHFLFNSLNSIYYLAIKKTDEAPKAIIALSDMMRYVLTEASDAAVSLEKEVDYIQKYINLQKLRLPKHTLVHTEIEIEDEDLEIAPLLLIPFIENAFKYGVSARKETAIDLQIKVDDRQLNMVLINTIIDYESEAAKTQIGIENVRKQLNLLYPHRHTLIINNENGLFKVVLNLIVANT
ncbi:MAG: sensor histidine kinase [Saprospiraceae bacterium]